MKSVQDKLSLISARENALEQRESDFLRRRQSLGQALPGSSTIGVACQTDDLPRSVLNCVANHLFVCTQYLKHVTHIAIASSAWTTLKICVCLLACFALII